MKQEDKELFLAGFEHYSEPVLEIVNRRAVKLAVFVIFVYLACFGIPLGLVQERCCVTLESGATIELVNEQGERAIFLTVNDAPAEYLLVQGPNYQEGRRNCYMERDFNQYLAIYGFRESTK